MSQKVVEIRQRRQDRGLRMSFTLHLPPEVARALETLAAYTYEQAVAEGASMARDEYLERELDALGADLAYVETRFGQLADEVEPRREELREIVAMLGEVRHHLEGAAGDA